MSLAHTIRRQATTLYQAAASLDARSRWCLTGTPIQNGLEDLGSLLTFIRASPFGNMTVFRKLIILPILGDTSDAEERCDAKEKLIQLLDALCLRRTKERLHLPEPIERSRIVEFSAQERQQYENTLNIMSRTLQQNHSPDHRKNPFGAFQIQLQLRLLCNLGTYQQQFAWTNERDEQSEIEDALLSLGPGGLIKCSSCQQFTSVFTTTAICSQSMSECQNVLCDECAEQTIAPSLAFPCNQGGKVGMASGLDSKFCVAEDLVKSTWDFPVNLAHSSKIIALVKDVMEDVSCTKR
jgi:SWI/SNF-related matrix-associated actin-dependent regulator of chromatin subfamily A3